MHFELLRQASLVLLKGMGGIFAFMAVFWLLVHALRRIPPEKEK